MPPPSVAVSSAAARPFQTEEEWIVQQVSQSLADMGRQVRKEDLASVSVKENNVANGGRGYEIAIGGTAQTISIVDGVWNPISYLPLARAAFTTPDLEPLPASDLDFLRTLLSPNLQMFLEEDSRLSHFLTEHPSSGTAHLYAALLLGTLGLNDYSGDFRDVRIILNRLTAHLAAADALGVPPSSGGRRLAESIRLTLCGQQADALLQVKGLPSGRQKVYDEWREVLRLKNTGDWRQGRAEALAGSDALKLEYFRALVSSIGAVTGMQFLQEANVSPMAGYSRIANEQSLSVSQGHFFTKSILEVEFQEIVRGAQAFQIAVKEDDLNWLKDYFGDAEAAPIGIAADRLHIEVLGQTLVAGFHERHLMQGINRLFGFLHDSWGVKEEADHLMQFVHNRLPELRYKPFLRRMIARDRAERLALNKACEAIIRERPESVTPALWVALRDDENRRAVLSTPDYHGWFQPEVPVGTAFEVAERLYQIGVGDEKNHAWMKELSRRAPYAYKLAWYNAYHENDDSFENMSSEIITRWMGDLVEFDLRAMRLLASSLRGQPGPYEIAMERVTRLDPDNDLVLGSYFKERGMVEKAMEAYLRAFERANDRVFMANESLPLVRYLFEKGDYAMAKKVAEDAAEVYSYKGLGALVWLLEQQGDWKRAVETARRIDERYNEDGPIAEVACLIRFAANDNNQQAVARDYERRVSVLFPNGIRKVTVSDFEGAPQSGVLIDGESKLLVPFALRKHMVIVALNGLRTDTFSQYKVVRELSDNPSISVIYWDGSAYRLSEGTLPGRRFGVNMVDYTP